MTTQKTRWFDDLRLIIAAFFQCLAVILLLAGALQNHVRGDNLNLWAGFLMQGFVAVLVATKLIGKR